MEDKIKICHIIDTLCIGGRENVVINICNGLDKTKYKVYLIVLSNDNLPQINKVEKYVTVVILPFPESYLIGIHLLHFLFTGMPYLKRLLSDINPSIVHTHSALIRLFFVSLAIKLSFIKNRNFNTIHTSGAFYTPKNWFERLQLKVQRRVIAITKPKIIAVSKEVEKKCNLLLSNCYDEIRCIPNGINVNSFYLTNNPQAKITWGFNESDIVIVYVSRLCYGKSHLTLLKAIEILHKKIDKIKLCIIGDGELWTSLNDYVNRNSLDKFVVFQGATNKVPEILSICNIGVFPSEYEGMSIALLEMMAAGLPIVCSDIVAFKQLFSEPDSAIFFPVMDHVSLSAQLEVLCNSISLQKNMGEKAKSIAKEYSTENMIRKHEDYYK